jgi:hypothetical protein
VIEFRSSLFVRIGLAKSFRFFAQVVQVRLQLLDERVEVGAQGLAPFSRTPRGRLQQLASLSLQLLGLVETPLLEEFAYFQANCLGTLSPLIGLRRLDEEDSHREEDGNTLTGHRLSFGVTSRKLPFINNAPL